MRESALQRAIIVALEAHGAYVVRVVAPTRSGIADLIVCWHGRFIALEVKTPAGRVTPLQLVEAGRVAEAGGQFFVVRSVIDALAALTPI